MKKVGDDDSWLFSSFILTYLQNERKKISFACLRLVGLCAGLWMCIYIRVCHITMKKSALKIINLVPLLFFIGWNSHFKMVHHIGMSEKFHCLK